MVQKRPLKPAGHTQEKRLTPSRQVAPLAHGCIRQSSRSVWQRRPPKPARQRHVSSFAKPSASSQRPPFRHGDLEDRQGAEDESQGADDDERKKFGIKLVRRRVEGDRKWPTCCGNKVPPSAGSSCRGSRRDTDRCSHRCPPAGRWRRSDMAAQSTRPGLQHTGGRANKPRGHRSLGKHFLSLRNVSAAVHCTATRWKIACRSDVQFSGNADPPVSLAAFP